MYVKSRNETFPGIHKPLISAELFAQVQDVKSGKRNIKVSKHDHVYRRMFRCTKCSRSLTGERQKGHVYYRCHTRGCTKGSIREEIIDQAVGTSLRSLELTPLQQSLLLKRLRKWGQTIQGAQQDDSIPLQLGKLKNKQDQLLDAYLDGVISKEIYEGRKQDLLISEQELSQKQGKTLSQEQFQQHLEDLFELLKSLYCAYFLAKAPEKRRFLKILFSNRSVTDKNIELEPRSWLGTVSGLRGVLFGPHFHDNFRKNDDVPFPVSEDTKAFFASQEWQELKGLHENIWNEAKYTNMPEDERDSWYQEAA